MIVATSKYCNGCDKDKPLEAFSMRSKGDKKVPRSRCRECESEAYKAWSTNRVQPIYERHGMSLEEYQMMYDYQGGRCAVDGCGNRIEVIDHDHACCPGKRSCGECVTGLLCSGCNTAEGMLAGSPERARGLADYIERTRTI